MRGARWSLSILLLTLLSLLPLPATLAGEADSPHLIWYRQAQPVVVQRTWSTLLTAVGSPEGSTDRLARTQALADAFVRGPAPSERSAGIEGLLPGGSLEEVRLEAERVGLWLTLPPELLDGWDEIRSDRLTRALVGTLGQVEGVRGLQVFARRAGEQVHRPIDEFLPVLPPVPSKSFEAPADRAAGQPGVPGQGQPAGALSGKSIFLSQSHGWYYNSSSGAWITQRGLTNDLIEDFINAEAINQYLVQYLWNAGAGVYTCRERDMRTDEAIVDNTDGSYSDSGGWSTSSSTPDYYGTDYRTMPVSTIGGAEAVWEPTIPEAGSYEVYVWYTGGSNRSEDAAYTVHHSGGDTAVVQNQQQDGYTWKSLGSFHFDPADPAERRRLTLSNLGSDPAQYVIADAVRLGGGMGSVVDGGSVSGRPRWEESGRYFAEFMGCSTCGTGTVSSMPRYAAWESEGWEDSVYISWHTNAPNPWTGTSSFVYTSGPEWGDPFEGVAGSEELQDFLHAELIGDIRAGYDPGWTDRGQWTANFGEVNPSNNSEMPAVLFELAFHDTPSDALKLKDPKFRQLAARAVCQGIVKYFADRDTTSVELLPEPPEEVRVFNLAGGTVRIEWAAPPYDTGSGLLGDSATGYRVYLSGDGYGFADAVTTSNPYLELPGRTPGELLFVRVAATNDGGESFPCPTLAVRVPAGGGTAPLLVVDGFDRLDRSALISQYESAALGTDQRMFLDRMNTYSYAVPHAWAAEPYGCGLDSCLNEAVGSGAVDLGDYQAVDWILGEESTLDETFSTVEQGLVETFLDGGGGLFVSGAEIGWDLDAQGSTGDRSFFNGYLRADYVVDGAGVYAVVGSAGSIFEGLSSMAFDDGSLIYDVDWPDGISPLGGAVTALQYDGTAYNAGIQYEGTGKVVTLGFPFESLVSESDRETVMDRVLTFLLGEATPTPTPTSPPSSATPTRTPTRTPTGVPPTVTRTPTRTSTRSPTRTPTRTPTGQPPTASPTRTPTRTPTPVAPVIPAASPLGWGLLLAGLGFLIRRRHRGD